MTRDYGRTVAGQRFTRSVEPVISNNAAPAPVVIAAGLPEATVVTRDDSQRGRTSEVSTTTVFPDSNVVTKPQIAADDAAAAAEASSFLDSSLIDRGAAIEAQVDGDAQGRRGKHRR